MENGHDSSIAGFAPALRGFGLRLTLRVLDALLEFWQDDRWNPKYLPTIRGDLRPLILDSRRRISG